MSADVLDGEEACVKRDRGARLARVASLLHQNHPRGLTAREIARRIDVNVRTVYRDLGALERELGVPIWEDKGRFGTEQSAFLPPLKLSLLEAVTLFLSARLMARYANRKDKHVLSAFGKLASVLPAPIARHVDATIASMGDGPIDDHYASVFDVVASAWANSRKVRIWYPRTGTDGQTVSVERIVAPVFLQPNAEGHGCYLIARDDLSQHTRTFKLERIERAELTREAFEAPSDVELPALLANAWTVSDGELTTVRVRFHDAAAARRAQENRRHPSQQQQVGPDGCLELTSPWRASSRSRPGFSPGATRLKSWSQPSSATGCPPSPAASWTATYTESERTNTADVIGDLRRRALQPSSARPIVMLESSCKIMIDTPAEPDRHD